MEQTISADILGTYRDVDMEKVEQMLCQEIRNSKKKIVVLDDDPTGVQTVHDVSVYTNWTEEDLRQGFEEENNLFYILTNSRGFTAAQTEKVHREIAAAVSKVAADTGREFLIMSRSDSTLRGHYPLETQILREGIEKAQGIRIDGEIICPFFKEGGRFTVNNTHYVKYGDDLVPAAQTEFAKDKTFGYTHSDICEYVEEKTGGAYKAEDVTCIALEDLRNMELDKIVEQLCAVKGFSKIVVNAIDYADVKIMSIAIYRAMARGKNFMFRTAAALVKEMGGISAQPLLTREKMVVKETDNGGVIVVGSHTRKTTEQLEELKRLDGIESIEFNSDLVLNEVAFKEETERVTRRIGEIVASGKTAVAYTKRQLLVVENDTKEDALLRSVKISDAVQSLVGNLETVPSFVIAKGGITSSDVGTKALRVKRATVMGQIRPGIPVWQTGEESKFPLTPYVIFPGNVGDANTLREAAEILMKKA
ncbi:MAG: hydroxyacid dehydrogenase [Lachnospiraceae bacterium]|nr:hydroxyacid dehydrogenase [Lachnospiraceae bacterium]